MLVKIGEFLKFKTRKHALIFIVGVFVSIILGIVFLNLTFAGNPDRGIPCFLNSAVGLHCPGCGCTRATLNLVSGNFSKAFWYNPFYCVSLTIVFIIFVRFIINAFKKDYVPFYLDFKPAYYIPYIVFTVAFIIVRNFDFYRAVFY